MSVQTPSLPVRPHADHAGLVRRAKLLSWLSVGWMAIEAGVATIAALIAGSVALLGFGLDSLIELVSASVVIWRFTGARAESQAAERRAQQLIAGCFAALAAYLVFDGIRVLVTGSHPNVSWPGGAVAAAAVVLMPLLACAKSHVAAKLSSAATAGDAAQSWLCAIAAAGVLVSVLANAAISWWWLDPIIGLAIAVLAAREDERRGRGSFAASASQSASSRRWDSRAASNLRVICRPVGSGVGGAVGSECSAAVAFDDGSADGGDVGFEAQSAGGGFDL